MWNIKDIIQKAFSTYCSLELVLQGRSLLKGSICSQGTRQTLENRKPITHVQTNFALQVL